MGLVSRVVPDDELLDACLDVAERCARFSPYGLPMTKDVIWANLENPSLEAAIELEDRNQLMLGFTENLPEAIRAFDEGRDPCTPMSRAAACSRRAERVRPPPGCEARHSGSRIADRPAPNLGLERVRGCRSTPGPGRRRDRSGRGGQRPR